MVTKYTKSSVLKMADKLREQHKTELEERDSEIERLTQELSDSELLNDEVKTPITDPQENKDLYEIFFDNKEKK